MLCPFIVTRPAWRVVYRFSSGYRYALVRLLLPIRLETEIYR